jgi:cytidylate kinase
MALYLLRTGTPEDDMEAVSSACRGADISLRYDSGEQTVLLNGENVSGLIRTPEVSQMASKCSVNGDVRARLVELQQKLGREQNVVMDGRDIGTVVLPDAQVKIYLTADTRVRAERRYREMLEKGEEADLDQIEREIIERDHRDMTREISPLRKAPDAVEVDTSHMDIEQVTEVILGIIRGRKGAEA